MYSENSKIFIRLDSISKQIYKILVIFRLKSVFETTALLNLPRILTFSFFFDSTCCSLLHFDGINTLSVCMA